MSPAAVKLTKGEATRSQILAAAVQQASASGFESLTIGSLAERIGMSKSGLFAHFGSKLELQIATLDEAARLFTQSVFLPAMSAPRGLRRLRTLFENWLTWTERASLPGGCPVDAATREYIHQPGAMREAALDRQKLLDRELTKAVQMAIDAGELAGDADATQIAYDMTGIVLASYRTALILGTAEAGRRARSAFGRLLASHSAR